jgi:predicted anti-sigma-YlaC factor YlaD
MKCAEIEQLIPAWLEKDLPPEEQAMVSLHLERCARCGDVAADLAVIETVLEMRRAAVPPASRTVAALLGTAGRSRARTILDFAFGGPCLAAWTMLALGVILFVFRSKTVFLFSPKLGLFERLSFLSERLVQGIVHVSGGDAWILAAVYGGLTLLMVLVSAWTVMSLARARQ